jgi:RNA polymerase sigma-70 factor (ECF subfamily)
MSGFVTEMGRIFGATSPSGFDFDQDGLRRRFAGVAQAVAILGLPSTLAMRPELVEASDLLRQQTPESIEAAIGLLQGTVFSFSMKMCGHREDAEDTAQEVLFSSLKHLRKLDNPSALAAWLYTVARNRCRRNRGKIDVSDRRHLSLDELMPDRDELQFLMRASGATPEQHALKAEEKELLQQAILRLPTSLRLVLVLHDMEELNAGDVARILDLKEGTVRVRLHRARLTVRQELTRMAGGMPARNASPRNAGRRRATGCREIFANLSEYIDERVQPGDCEQMQKHIDRCPPCMAFLTDLKAAIDRCRSLSVSCDPAVAERMRALMTKEYLRMMASGDSR